MLPIHKNIIDPLREHCSRPDATYANIPTADREKLVKSLLQEQGYLCAYCMCRINETTLKVEHWKCRSHFPDLQLDYKNMLAVCNGNEGHPEYEQHCDTQKKNTDLKYNPADPTHYAHLKISYVRATGKIESNDTTYSKQFGDLEKGNTGVLNLNYGFPLENRKNIIESIRRALSYLPSNAPKSKIRALLAVWTSPDEHGMLKEYAGVAIYFLEKRLKMAH